MSDESYKVEAECPGSMGIRVCADYPMCTSEDADGNESFDECGADVGLHLEYAADGRIVTTRLPVTLHIEEGEASSESVGATLIREERQIHVGWATEGEREYIVLDLTEAQARQLHEALGRFLDGWPGHETWLSRQ
jgi:hypothetical protein